MLCKNIFFFLLSGIWFENLRIIESGVDISYLISVEHKEQLHYLKISGRDYDRDGRGGGSPLELESKVPEDFTIMTLAPKHGI